VYRYKAVTVDGDLLEGEMESSDQAGVIAHIQQSGNIPIRAEQARTDGLGALLRRGFVRARRLRPREIALFTQELSSLLHAGLPLDRSLQIMIEVTEDKRLQKLTTDIQEAVRGGAALSAALEAQKGVFSRFYISLIHAAEAAGTLDTSLARLADYLERNKALKDNVVSALLYPAILVSSDAHSRSRRRSSLAVPSCCGTMVGCSHSRALRWWFMCARSWRGQPSATAGTDGSCACRLSVIL
jgi:general secretion pathway protein F